MLTEEKLLPIFDCIDPNTKTLSVLIQTIIKRDDVEISRENHRRAFVPGDIEKVKTYIGVTESPEITYLESIWTQEVIDAHQALQNE